MKSKCKLLISLLLPFFITSCGNSYQGKNLNEMNLSELNSYNSDLKWENKSLKRTLDDYLEKTESKNSKEIVELINELNNEVIKSNVMITNESKLLFHTTAVASGSGTIIKEDNGFYYVLTNNHVIYSLGTNSSYFIYDYLNNEYHATLLFHDPNYDMAVLRFNKINNLRVAKFSSSNAKVGDNVIAIGQPKGQRNAITFGEVLMYDRVTCNGCNEEESNIDYECVYYNANTNYGNSGGMLINYDFELVGVVTYGLTDAGGNYAYGAGSPIEKVREFLTLNNLEVGESSE